MSSPTVAPNVEGSATPKSPRKRRHWGNSLVAQGEPSIWLTGGALAVAICMIVGLLVLVLVQGASTFWPIPAVQIKTVEGKTLLGEVTRTESYQPEQSVFDALPPGAKEKAMAEAARTDGVVRRRLLRTGNFELTGVHHHWVSDFQIAEEDTPKWALVVERFTWGNFYGTPTAFFVDEKKAGDTPERAWELFNEHHAAVLGRLKQRISLERDDLGAVSRKENNAFLSLKDAGLRHGKNSPDYTDAAKRYAEIKLWAAAQEDRINGEISALNAANDRFQIQLVTADNQEKKIPLAQIDRAYPANQLGTGDKLAIYLARWGEYLSERPREANTEGGVFPAIWGTVAMTLLMSLAVVPFGVLAALYLREYAKSGPIVSAVRIAINNLAGVPSIVFGVFGMGFFCYLCGAFIDGGPRHIQMAPLPPLQWWLALTAAVLAGLVAFVLFIGSNQASARKSRWSGLLGRGSGFLWLACVALIILLVVRSPFFDGFYRAKLPGPTFGTGGVLWAALTLALLTLPVVIVATEEALAAVPNSMREGSYACGASKWQTIRHIVLPRAMPGIMTGMILAMARGAGEVAPIMLTGAVKLVEHLPVDGVYPYVHLERSFMHLGFHIYDVGFQSPNSEAARPMVYTTTLLLIFIVALLNVTAIWLRRRLRARFMVGHF
jgi:ABC-type phosphate transport system permease subunit/ABC-type phosphate transport system auxiliary subunit